MALRPFRDFMLTVQHALVHCDVIGHEVQPNVLAICRQVNGTREKNNFNHWLAPSQKNRHSRSANDVSHKALFPSRVRFLPGTLP